MSSFPGISPSNNGLPQFTSVFTQRSGPQAAMNESPATFHFETHLTDLAETHIAGDNSVSLLGHAASERTRKKHWWIEFKRCLKEKDWAEAGNRLNRLWYSRKELVRYNEGTLKDIVYPTPASDLLPDPHPVEYFTFKYRGKGGQSGPRKANPRFVIIVWHRKIPPNLQPVDKRPNELHRILGMPSKDQTGSALLTGAIYFKGSRNPRAKQWVEDIERQIELDSSLNAFYSWLKRNSESLSTLECFASLGGPTKSTPTPSSAASSFTSSNCHLDELTRLVQEELDSSSEDSSKDSATSTPKKPAAPSSAFSIPSPTRSSPFPSSSNSTAESTLTSSSELSLKPSPQPSEPRASPPSAGESPAVSLAPAPATSSFTSNTSKLINMTTPATTATLTATPQVSGFSPLPWPSHLRTATPTQGRPASPPRTAIQSLVSPTNAATPALLQQHALLGGFQPQASAVAAAMAAQQQASANQYLAAVYRHQQQQYQQQFQQQQQSLQNAVQLRPLGSTPVPASLPAPTTPPSAVATPTATSTSASDESAANVLVPTVSALNSLVPVLGELASVITRKKRKKMLQNPKAEYDAENGGGRD